MAIAGNEATSLVVRRTCVGRPRAGSFPGLYKWERSEITAVVFEALVILAVRANSLCGRKLNVLKLFDYFNRRGSHRLLSVTVCARNEELRGLPAPQVLSPLARASNNAFCPLSSQLAPAHTCMWREPAKLP
jgi:hypothetical protein